jgi:hypothetical protein
MILKEILTSSHSLTVELAGMKAQRTLVAL